MKERPILFSGPMVRAILEGRKTVTRRVMKPQPDFLGSMVDPNTPFKTLDAGLHARITCPYGKPGDRLWVRESFAECYDYCDHPEMPGAPTEHFHLGWHYRADGEPKREELDGFLSHWKPSIHMPRWASRILLEITAVRVERLQDITEDQAIAEGIDTHPMGFYGNGCITAGGAFLELWESINGDGRWAANPWVWVVEFKRVTP
ncbi:TPA: hypothetical protein ACHSVW_005957 [Pseudomonas aeruginosa]|uniref:hypothetical protein n=1 Tax=Pseudomonas aeruginosa TaxID=287 RepID=UPI00300C3C40